MNVLVLSHMYPNRVNKVLGVFVHLQVKALIKAGCNVRVISPVPLSPFPVRYVSKRWNEYAKIPKSLHYDGVQVYHPRYLEIPRGYGFARTGEWMYNGCKALVREVLRDFSPAVIHAHVALPDGYAAMLLARELQLPFVITVHGQDMNVTIHKSPECRARVEEAFRASSKIVFVSNMLKQVAVEHLGYEDKYTVIGNGVDLAHIGGTSSVGGGRQTLSCTSGRGSSGLHSKSDTVHMTLQSKPDAARPTILSVSNLVRPKGVDLNIEAMQVLVQKYPNLRYIIVGGGPELPKLQQMVVEMGLTGNVEFTGRLEHQAALALMNQCDLFLLPSWQEGFGVVYIEAMAHGKVAIGCRGQGIDGVIEHGVNGFLVEPRDVQSIVQAVDLVLANPELQTQIGSKARETVLNGYTWQHNAEKNLQVYREVVGEE